MRLVAVTRLLNEDDVVEAFARHHAAVVDHHVFLDNGSTDRTVQVLRALHAEGLPLSVLQNRSVQFCENSHNTYLYRIAVDVHGADWVACLDADEFLDGHDAAAALRAVLSALPPGAAALGLRLANFHASAADDPADLLVPRRLRRRAADMPEVLKVIARGRGAAPGTGIAAGNHEVLVGGRQVPPARTEALRLAHYPQRHPLQMLTKAVLGRLKVLAGGAETVRAGFSSHYDRFLEALRDEPQALLGDPGFMGGVGHGVPLVEDPARYLGGPLRHTRAEDPVLRAVRAAVGAAELLARRHGRLLDENVALRGQTQQWDAEFVRLV